MNYNPLSSIDLSQNVQLRQLYCSSNDLTQLDLSNNINLGVLYCSFNSLTSLDLTENKLLGELICGSNQLTSLNIKNDFNFIFATLETTDNPDLACIEVDDVTFANNPTIEDLVETDKQCRESAVVYIKTNKKWTS